MSIESSKLDGMMIRGRSRASDVADVHTWPEELDLRSPEEGAKTRSDRRAAKFSPPRFDDASRSRRIEAEAGPSERANSGHSNALSATSRAQGTPEGRHPQWRENPIVRGTASGSSRVKRFSKRV